jgi:DNA polymerase III gamma/tau subunit
VTFKIADLISCANAAGLLEEITRLADSGKNMADFFEEMMAHFERLLICKLAKNPGDIIDDAPEIIERCRAQSANFDAARLIKIIETLNESYAGVRRAKVPEILAGAVFVGLCGDEISVNSSQISGTLKQSARENNRLAPNYNKLSEITQTKMANQSARKSNNSLAFNNEPANIPRPESVRERNNDDFAQNDTSQKNIVDERNKFSQIESTNQSAHETSGFATDDGDSINGAKVKPAQVIADDGETFTKTNSLVSSSGFAPQTSNENPTETNIGGVKPGPQNFQNSSETRVANMSADELWARAIKRIKTESKQLYAFLYASKMSRLENKITITLTSKTAFERVGKPEGVKYLSDLFSEISGENLLVRVILEGIEPQDEPDFLDEILSFKDKLGDKMSVE